MSYDTEVPRLAVYRIWSGKSPDTLTPITRSEGDGSWGTLGGAFFLASGSSVGLQSAYEKWAPTYGTPTMATEGQTLEIPAKAVDADILLKLKKIKNK